MRHLLFAVSAIAALVIATPVAATTTPVAVTITGATLTARVAVTLKFDVVCQPITDFANTDVVNASYGAAMSVDQAGGRSIAHASAGDTMPFAGPITCDGSTVNHLSLTGISSTVPFHGGPAVVSVSVGVDDPACSFCGGFEFGSTRQTVSLK